jgi:hypothetical protein
VRAVWSWTDAIETIWVNPRSALTVERHDGSHDLHTQTFATYRIDRVAGQDRTVSVLRGLALRPREPHPSPETANVMRVDLAVGRPAVFELGQSDYRRSEETWREAGRPTARIELRYEPHGLGIDITVRKAGELTFMPANAANPYDNESPDINGDGVQLYLVDANGASAWLLVPEAAGSEVGIREVRARAIEDWRAPRAVSARWTRRSSGYSVDVQISSIALDDGGEFRLGVVINEKPPDRVRRRGQLALGGAQGEFVFLRGDREDADRLPRFRVTS